MTQSAAALAKQQHTPERREAMQEFVASAGWVGAELKLLAGDASFRRYERVFWQGKQAVLMDAPPEKEDVVPFVNVAKYLEALGFSAPHIMAEDRENGFLLLEDLGDDSYTKLLASAAPAELVAKERLLYTAAVDVLAELHAKNRKGGVTLDIPVYDRKFLMQEVNLLPDWFLPAVMGQGAKTEKLAAEFKDLWEKLLDKYTPAQSVLVMRDYHADNLLWLPDRLGSSRVGLLDFQDALVGHPAYDLVSLLEDARRDVLPETVEAAIQHYLTQSGMDADEFAAAYAFLGAQRNAKIIGIFVRLGVRDGKKTYTRYLPRVWRHFEHDLQHPLLAPVKEWVDAHILPEWRGAIELA